MTTLFEEADNTNPPSPSELLDAPSIKREVNGSKKIANQTEDGLNSASSPGESQEASGDSFTTTFVSDGSHMTDNVRVVHVQTVNEGGGGTGSGNTNNSGSQVTTSQSSGALYAVGGGQLQQVISPGDSSIGTVAVDGTNQDGTRYTYYPAVQTNDNSQGGQFYVMMSPQEVIPVTGGSGGPRIIAPRAQTLSTKVESNRSSRDERRRATHNEVERRRRDKINTWIMKIAAVVPDCQMDQSKQGTSKGGVLSKALDHIVKLRQENERMRENMKEQERVLVENQVLRQQVEKLRQESSNLQAHLNLQLRQNEPLDEDDGKLDED